MDRVGLLKTSLLDFPGRVAAVIFTPGCNLRCPWCHNPKLVQAPYDPDLLPIQEVLEFLERRRAVLGGVAVTGGEPLYHQDLADFLHSIRKMGYSIKLDTNGTYPKRLEELDPDLVDYVAMDVKNAPSRYFLSAGVPVLANVLRQSLDLLESRWKDSCELRLTWVPGLNSFEELTELADFIGKELPMIVTGFRPGPCLDAAWNSARAATPAEVQRVVETLVQLGVRARVR
ncbi:MAG: anaerobic ribonucleoside-triphosphate reductase activating protein [Spirochaetales bacterium]|nr:anaerobic ribonucleoside-triphosphate reductase activating protein [Spirochaetales bacterium]